jgi:hypothetical protein
MPGVYGAAAPEKHILSLVDCAMARCVWALADEQVVKHMSATTETSDKSWIFSMMEPASTTLWSSPPSNMVKGKC